ncbi:hypothetical protein Barb7_02899 [Bacteroidales bacterium Barb7]|nr:hypothetical protein Barb7_02899 [Bacteroidales bacterium Barb7]
MYKFIKRWMLPLAMLTGIAAYPLLSPLIFLTPFLVFAMLLLTFCKLSPHDIHIRPAHLWLLLIQLTGSIAVYAAICPFNPLVAQGALVCILVPTATAAVVITGMLGGNVAFITTYQLLSNIAVALAAPAIFSLVGTHTQMPFLESFLYICRRIVPVLILPLFLAWLMRSLAPAVHRRLTALQEVSFYIWSFSLTLVTASTVNSLVNQETHNYTVEFSLAAVSLLICIGQFLLGRRIGRHYGDSVSAGQGLGQKNTILAIWMAHAYLNPISSIAPAAYVLWQNLINSLQLWRKDKRQGK